MHVGPSSQDTNLDATNQDNVRSSSTAPVTSTQSASFALHWTIFTFLCLFFIEVGHNSIDMT